MTQDELARLSPFELAELTEDQEAFEFGTEKSLTGAQGHYDITRADSTYDGQEKLFFNERLSPRSPPRRHNSEVFGFEAGWLDAGQDAESIRWRALEQFYHPNSVRERAAQAAVDLWVREQKEAAADAKKDQPAVDWIGGTADGLLARAEQLLDAQLESQGLTRDDVTAEAHDTALDAALQIAVGELQTVAPEGIDQAVLRDLQSKYVLIYTHLELVARQRLEAIRKRHLDPHGSPVNWRALGALMGRRGRALDEWAEYMGTLAEAVSEERSDAVAGLTELDSAERELASTPKRAEEEAEFERAKKEAAETTDGATRVRDDLAALRALERGAKTFTPLPDDVYALLSPDEKAAYDAARAAHEGPRGGPRRSRRKQTSMQELKDELRALEAEEAAAAARARASKSQTTGADDEEVDAEEAARIRRSEFKPSDFIPYSRPYIRGLMSFPLLTRRTTQQTGKGKINSMYVCVVVGNGDGLVGVGEGKDMDSRPKAHAKAIADAVRNMDVVERFEGRTIWTEVQSKMGATRVIMRPRPVGFGLHCNPYIHQILKAAGIKDISAKVWGSRNPLNVIKTAQRLLHAGHAPVRLGAGTMGSTGRRTEAGSGVRGREAVERERGRRLVPGRAW